VARLGLVRQGKGEGAASAAAFRFSVSVSAGDARQRRTRTSLAAWPETRLDIAVLMEMRPTLRIYSNMLTKASRIFRTVCHNGALCDPESETT
jgi:hypothetical protein